MPVTTRAVLKTYFETGDRPTQAQFEDLIDSSIQTTTIFGRTGAIVAVTADYDAGQITDTATKVMMTTTERALIASLVSVVFTPSGGDDYTVVQAAINVAAAGTTDTVFEFGAGTFLFSAALLGTFNVAVSFKGAGSRQTILQWDVAATRGIHITYTDVTKRPEFHDLGFVTSVFAEGAAIKITGPALPSVTAPGPFIENIIIRPYSVSTDCWLRGINLIQCWNAVIRNVGIKGMDDATSPFDHLHGIELVDCPDNMIQEVYAYHVENVIRIGGSAASSVGGGDGLKVSNFVFVGVTNGIYLDRPPTTNGFWASDGHINAYGRGITLNNARNFYIKDMQIFKTHISTSNWEAIELTSCDYGVVHDCLLTCPGNTDPSFSIGVGVTDTAHCSIHDMQGAFWYPPGSNFIVVNSSSQDNYFSNISRPTNEANITNAILFSGAANNNRCNNIQPSAFQGFAANDSTPSVGNDVSGLWWTANTVGTLITRFDDTYSGMEFRLQFNDAKTTIQHNAGLILKGAVPCVSTTNNGGFLHFAVDQSGIVRETARSF